jgi:membrane associated rhomboid family serine protease
MNELIQQFYESIGLLQKNLSYIFIFLAILWSVHVLNWVCGYRLAIFGVYPRKWFSLLGIFVYPFIHSNFNHLFFNSIPLFILACFIILHGIATFFCITMTIIILSGLFIWLFARRGFHVGASGLIMGYWAFLLVNSYFAKGIIASFAPAFVCIYYFGGFLFHLFPTEVRTSFEAHIFGFIAGILAFYTCPVGYCALSTFLCIKMT